ncbi:MAG: choice-of-anchor D domain-containing protein, partial [Candidatus Krumholzibacteria bacterium]|nr:choice-of-anchor D domain-containing protein [Candidatus Krumholzibacteria bacterium]
MIRNGKPSFFPPALMPALFVLVLFCFIAAPVAAEEFIGKAGTTTGRDDRPNSRCELSVTELDFGEVAPGGSGEMSVTITNISRGTVPLKISLSRDCDVFSLTGADGMHHLRRGQSVEITVGFSPMEPGDHDCFLNLGQLAPGIPLVGMGGQFVTDLELDMEAIEFGEVIVDLASTLHLKITNTGSETYTLEPALADDPTDFSIMDGLMDYDLGPDGFVFLTMDFTPTMTGPHETVLSLGPGLPRLDVTGLGIEAVGACIITPGNLEFGPLTPGETEMQPIKITNTGNIDVPISASVNDPNFTVSKNSTNLRPGQSWVIAVTYAPLSWGTFSARVDLGNEFCAQVECAGMPTENFDPTMDNVGLFFDDGLTSNRTTTTEYLEIVDFHLAMLNPSNTSGIAAWECRIAIEGKASIISMHFEGASLNLGSGNEFIVGVGGDPLPYSPGILLASFQLVMQGYGGDTVELELRPRFLSSLPGMMVWLSSDDVYSLKPMFPVDGEPVVAIINDPADSAGRLAGTAMNKSADAGIPFVTRILPNAPNPFNPRTEIRFELAKAGQARLTIYDVTGRRVKTMHDGHLGSGPHSLVWQGRDDGG